ncbi:hypothetical protein DPMN_023084 [Dreissena polymorpha]|uniref:C2H2-type domain-containing protein n=1 Tax=Dreissena polymorpha TaxID=45954 RepID=A0A9D4RB25_DREPO|nr:hypothetical protein DPMN_023084 [Dreissena polymorpha]
MRVSGDMPQGSSPETTVSDSLVKSQKCYTSWSSHHSKTVDVPTDVTCVSFLRRGPQNHVGLKRHEDRHRGLSKYSCCEKQFSTKEDLTRHMCSAHGDTRQHVCPTCCATFATKTDLTNRRRDDSSVRFRCDVCGAELKERVD